MTNSKLDQENFFTTELSIINIKEAMFLQMIHGILISFATNKVFILK